MMNKILVTMNKKVLANALKQHKPLLGAVSRFNFSDFEERPAFVQYHNLFLQGVSADTTEESIRAAFGNAEGLNNVRIMPQKDPSRVLVFVGFDTQESQAAALA